MLLLLADSVSHSITPEETQIMTAPQAVGRGGDIFATARQHLTQAKKWETSMFEAVEVATRHLHAAQTQVKEAESDLKRAEWDLSKNLRPVWKRRRRENENDERGVHDFLIWNQASALPPTILP